MNFLDKLPKAEREALIRKFASIEARQLKPVTAADHLRELIRRQVRRGRTYFTTEEGVDYKG